MNLNTVEQIYFNETGNHPYESLVMYGGNDSDIPTVEYVEWLEARLLQYLQS
jgi:hypothetical protein